MGTRVFFDDIFLVEGWAMVDIFNEISEIYQSI
jgi:hypothetical protein